MKVLRFLILVLITPINLWGQDLPELPKPKKFISKVEIFAGPSLSFSYGNESIENYEDELITNKRLIKVGYTFGIGLYHELNNRFNLNARFSLEQRGTKSELNHPLNPVNDETRQIITSDYTYNYSTLSLSCQTKIGEKRKLLLVTGGYFSKIYKTNGLIEYYDEISGSTYNKFKGKYWQKIATNGGINSSTFIPGLQSFEDFEYGITLGFAYSFVVNQQSKLSINLIDNLGLTSVFNKKFDENLTERNHTLSLLISYIHNRPFKKSRN